MSITRKSIEKIALPYLVRNNGVTYIRSEDVDAFMEDINSKYINVYIVIEKSEIGRDKLVVGNLTSKVKKPLYTVHIEG